jgi:CheY-like chemotaxis protein
MKAEPDQTFALVVDDDALVLMHACDILEDAGFDCLQADDGDAALALLSDSADDITLLFSDVEMPGDTDGFRLARTVAERWPHIEIVVASGRIVPQPHDLPPRATFIGKPFSAMIVREHLAAKLPDEKKPEPLKAEASR